jgi:hypothetical protein
VNECLNNPCENGGACLNYPGDFFCSCAFGNSFYLILDCSIHDMYQPFSQAKKLKIFFSFLFCTPLFFVFVSFFVVNIVYFFFQFLLLIFKLCYALKNKGLLRVLGVRYKLYIIREVFVDFLKI